MRRFGRKVAALGMVLLLGLTAACVPTAEEITPTPAEEEVNFRLWISDEANA
ncbi:unnamed protein product, partial [marine sediment metagenome]